MQVLVELARETWAAGEPLPAQRLLARALGEEPNHLDAVIASAELALLADDAQTALQLALHAIELHPRQIGPYLLGARAAADLLDRDKAERLLNRARASFGCRPEIIAAQIHLFRQYRDYDAAHAIVAEAGEQVKTDFGLWMQVTSFAVAQGKFDIVEQAFRCAPAFSTKEMSGVHFLRASLAEARRQYHEAVTGYEAAITFDGAAAEYHEAAARCSLLLADTDRTRYHLRAAKRLDAATNIARGISSNISQHHVGQMLDEFLLHQEALGELRRISALPVEARVDPLRRLVKNNPEQTAPAILLLLAMRQVGLLRV